MIFVLIDIVERILKYLKPFTTAPDKELMHAPIPNPDPGPTQPPRENLLADHWIEPLVHIDDINQDENQDARLADYIAKTKDDPRNDGPRKLGNIYRKDRITPVYPKLRFTTTIWNELYLNFSKYYSVSWDET